MSNANTLSNSNNPYINNIDKNLIPSQKLIDKYPDKCPIIIKSDLVDKKKYLVPHDLTLGQFNFILRKRIKNLNQEKSIFIFIQDKNEKFILKKSTDLIGTIFSECKNKKDGFLYANLQEENTFG